LVIIGGGVAGYVAAIKAGQAGMKVRQKATRIWEDMLTAHYRSLVSRSVAPSEEPA
jgi:2-polyprenyl-6-methoxyphenol hydroxylase-like FAD-dependent oxidoreductase